MIVYSLTIVDTNIMSSVWVVVCQQTMDNLIILEGIYTSEANARRKAE